ncbi:MAG: AraC family transcriptional regulator [Eubacteriales bacterium]|nr:AraC family transcriptional regulator [Eubacteriales bacterium]
MYDMYNLGIEIFPDGNKEDVIVQIINKGDNYYHSHNFYELFYITNGTIKHSLNNVTRELTIGDVVFLRPGDIHCFLREKGNLCAHRDIALTVPLYEKTAAFFKYDPLADLTAYAKTKIDVNTLSRLETDLQSTVNCDPVENSSLYFVLAELFRAMKKSDVNETPTSKAPEWILGLITKLEMPEFFCLNPNDIFDEINYSKEYVSRTFRKVTGKTLTDYLNQKKLSFASVLIQNTNKSIETICYECGYNNVSYFYRTFKKTFGKTPHELRKISPQ